MSFNFLIVDDSPAMRRFVLRVLSLSGLDVGTCLEASDGQEALDVLGKNWIDAVITDINMPRMDGEELVRRIGGDEALRGIPVLVVSTDCTDRRIKEMLTLGAKGYVKKPFLPETLHDELEHLLGDAYARS